MKQQNVNIIECQEVLEWSDSTDSIRAFLKMSKFNVGDYLIRRIRDDEDEPWQTECDANHMPTKYKYIWESEDGVGVIAELNKDGTWEDAEDLHSIVDLTGRDSFFVVDPEYQDHIILNANEPFDPCGLAREKFKENEEKDEFNKALVKKIIRDDYVSANRFLSQLKPGQKTWLCSSRDTRFIVSNGEYVVKKISKVKMSRKQIFMYLSPKTKKEQNQTFYYYTVLLTCKELSRSVRYNTMTISSGHDMYYIVGNPKTYESPIEN